MSHEPVALPIKVLPNGEGLPLPAYATQGAAAMDIYAAISEDVTLQPLERKIIPAGFALAIPQGYEVQIRARSGLSAKSGITVINGVGTIDSDYRGELGAAMVNLSNEAFTITRGMRIAQMVLARHEFAALQPVAELAETERGSGGFGSTGTQAEQKTSTAA